MKKTVQKLISFLLLLLLSVASAEPMTAYAAYSKMKVTIPGDIVTEGRYIYYAYSGSGIRTGIVRYDTKRKKKEIISDKAGGINNYKYFNLQISGNFIYVTCNQEGGSSGGKNYIYRFSKDGKRVKKLAMGSNPIVVGNYIYYRQERKIGEYSETEPTGYIYRMKKNGSSKEKIIKANSSYPILCRFGKNVLYAYDSEYYDLKGNKYSANNVQITNNYLIGYDDVIRKITKGYYTYYLTADSNVQNKLCRKNLRTKKTEVIATFNNGIFSVYFCGSYLMVYGSKKKDINSNEYGNEKDYVYCISLNGKSKRKLESWQPTG